jgi:nicotinate-nucleotide pyrophosphorylase (carboxylating)
MTLFMPDNAPLSPEILAHIRLALAEDIGTGDVTTNAIVPQDAMMKGQIIAKQDGIVAGLDVARCVYLALDEHVDLQVYVPEGAAVKNRQVLARVSGPARVLLTAERTALNYLGRMSGIATLANQFVTAVAGTGAVILDTRKTTLILPAHWKKRCARRGRGLRTWKSRWKRARSMMFPGRSSWG